MDIVSVAVEVESDDKEDRTEHRTLRDALGHWSRRGGAGVDVDELLPVCELNFSQERPVILFPLLNSLVASTVNLEMLRPQRFTTEMYIRIPST